MRKTTIFGLAVILIATLFVGCKKGENDPFSLLSRKARLVGEWTLSEADYSYTDVWSGDTDVTTYSYNGTQMTRTQDGDGNTYNYTEIVTIEKDGTFTSVITRDMDYWDDVAGEIKTGTYTETVEGLWYFIDGNKELDVKDKERVEFMLTSYKEVYPDGDTNTFNVEGKSNSYIMMMLLDRLANKELVMKYDEVYSEGGDSETMEGTKTYTQE